MNKREKKHLERRKNFLISELEIRQTCLALTNGLADDEFFENQKNEISELKKILEKLNLKNVKIGQSHKIYKMEI
jgi:ADP-glucose pyrophosphorylase